MKHSGVVFSIFRAVVPFLILLLQVLLAESEMVEQLVLECPLS